MLDCEGQRAQDYRLTLPNLFYFLVIFHLKGNGRATKKSAVQSPLTLLEWTCEALKERPYASKRCW